ncbi:MAG: YceI family protein [Candidatus Sumerlaeia bacterium]
MISWKRLIRSVSTAAAGTVLLATAWAAPETYEIDPAHSSVAFEIGHLAISTVMGRFDSFEGRFVFDPDNPAASSAEATIHTESVNTNIKKRDDHLRSGDYLEVEKYPAMTFKSKSVKDVTDEGFKVTGDLTLHGVTREVVLNVKNGGSAEMGGQVRRGFSATTELSRVDFGVGPKGGLPVGTTVKVIINVEGILKSGESAKPAAQTNGNKDEQAVKEKKVNQADQKAD